MEEDDSEVRECFAYFGRVIFLLQELEKGILGSLMLSYKNITQERFDELLAEKSQLTFGQIKRDIIENKIFNEQIIAKIERFHELRDWLIHNYWWDRSIEFYREDLRYTIKLELDKYAIELMELDNEIQKINTNFLIEKGVDPFQIADELSKLDRTPKNPEFRKLTKSETLIGVYLYEPIIGFQIPIFELGDNSYWTLCENGLTYFDKKLISSVLSPVEKTKEVFPIRQFNPKPKLTNDWNYELDLKKNGLFIKVRPSMANGKFAFKWSINRK